MKTGIRRAVGRETVTYGLAGGTDIVSLGKRNAGGEVPPAYPTNLPSEFKFK